MQERQPTKKQQPVSERELLALELTEVREISDLLVGRIEQKLAALEARERSLDRKIAVLTAQELKLDQKITALTAQEMKLDQKTAALEKLLLRTDAFSSQDDAGIRNRQHEILALRKNGMKTPEIAGILNVPAGEVDLILNLHAQNMIRQ